MDLSILEHLKVPLFFCVFLDLIKLDVEVMTEKILKISELIQIINIIRLATASVFMIKAHLLLADVMSEIVTAKLKFSLLKIINFNGIEKQNIHLLIGMNHIYDDYDVIIIKFYLRIINCVGRRESFSFRRSN